MLRIAFAVASVLAAAHVAIAEDVDPGPVRVFKCQEPDGRLYFGPSPPAGCVPIAVYEHGRQTTSPDPDASPTPEDGDGAAPG